MSPHDSTDLVVRSRCVVAPDAPGGIGARAIHIRNGTILAVAGYNDVPAGAPVHDAGDLVVMPGLVDTHVHINEPGRTGWEGFETATRAAAAGGVTTLVEMPLNSIPATTTIHAFREKLRAAGEKLHVDVGFWGGVVPGNVSELGGLAEAGVFGFKCFLVPSGVPEFAPVTQADLRAALPELVALGVPLLAHAELPGPMEKASKGIEGADPRRYSTWLAGRPPAAEDEAIKLLLRLAREFRARVHIVHLSSSGAVPLLRQAKQRGVAATAETCPHYLSFSAEEIPDGATQFKCAPPIRERENQERLWAALEEGVIDLVASDHSPCPPEMKCSGRGDFLRAWGGIASLELSLPAVWTQMRQRGCSLVRLANWMCRAPARLAGLEKRKGTIAPRYDADLVIWNPEGMFRVEPERLHHRHKLTPYAGRALYGVVEETFLRGRKIYDRGEFPTGPAGKALLRGRS